MQIFCVPDMVTKPTEASKRVRVSYNMKTVCLLHVRSLQWPSSGKCLTNIYLKLFEPMHKYKILRFKITWFEMYIKI